MASSNQTPDVLFSPIAANADASDINTIPQTYDPANYGYAAQNVGFPTECRLPVLNPDGTLGQGRAPRMQDWNGIMKLVSSHNFFLQNGGSYTFNPTVSSNIGGYPKNAVLWYFPENEAPCLVYSLINDNTNNFVEDPTLIDGIHWEMLVNPSSYANISLTNSPYTTNRILEIPQDIKLELNNGTLTLKGGSKVYDGTGYSWVTQTDMTRTLSTNGVWLFIIEKDSSTSHFYTIDKTYSQNTQPTNGGVWFNTDTNVTKWSNNGTTWGDCSLPIGIVTVSNGAISSIDQIFNGFGYIGSTWFVLQGVKGQSTYERNADGTYKSDIISVNNVLTMTRTDTSKTLYCNIRKNTNNELSLGVSYYFYTSKTIPTTGGAYSIVWCEEDGCWYVSNGGGNFTKAPYKVLGVITCKTDGNGKITSFEPYNVDSFVNSNEFYQLKDNAVTLTNDQTISGGKAFTNTVVSNSELHLCSTTSYNSTNPPASNMAVGTIRWSVNATSGSTSYLGGGKEFARIQPVLYTNGWQSCGFILENQQIPQKGQSILSIIQSADGSIYYAEHNGTVDATDNSTKIATTAWCTTASKEGNLIGAPNYSAAVAATINSSTSYTATKNGWIQAEMPTLISGGTNLYIDGVKIGLGYTQQNVYATYQVALAPIAKGSTVTTNVSMTIKFIPCK